VKNALFFVQIEIFEETWLWRCDQKRYPLGEKGHFYEMITPSLSPFSPRATSVQPFLAFNGLLQDCK